VRLGAVAVPPVATSRLRVCASSARAWEFLSSPRDALSNGAARGLLGDVLVERSANVRRRVRMKDSRVTAFWRKEYNEDRPHSFLGDLTPQELVNMHRPEKVA
jgi:transposase InsO family protein